MIFDRERWTVYFCRVYRLVSSRLKIGVGREAGAVKGTDTEAEVPGRGCYERGLVMLNSSQLTPLLPLPTSNCRQMLGCFA